MLLARHDFAAATRAEYPSIRFLYSSSTLGPNASSMIAMPLVMPKLVTTGAEQSWRRRTMT